MIKASDKLIITENAVFQFGKSWTADEAYNTGGHYAGNAVHAAWGKNDAALHEMHALTSDNSTQWRLLTTRRDFVIGNGARVKTIVEENGEEVLKFVSDEVTKSIKEFVRRTSLDLIFKNAGLSIEFCGRYFIKITIGFDLKVESLELIDVFQCRPRLLQAGESKVTAYVLNPAFGKPNYRRTNDVVLPAFDAKNPTKYGVSIIDIKEDLPGQYYNPFALWWGTKDWTIVSNKIAKFHISGLDNGYNIKYHISIPDNYFEQDGLTEKEEEILKQNVCQQISDSLKGVDKNNSVFFTFHPIDVNGKEMKGVTVTPLPNNLSDDAYTLLQQTAMKIETSACGLVPVLAGVDTGSKLGGSGKEMEVAANYTQNFLTASSRGLLLRLFEYCRLLEGWPDEKVLEFENFKMYNVDTTPTASNQNPND